MIDLGLVKDIAIVCGGVVALVTFVRGFFEYVRQGTQRRAEQFVQMRRRLKENKVFYEICSLLDTDDPKLAAVPLQDRYDFLGFFEEIVLLTNSGLLRKEVAYYMFAYYAIECWDSTHFWENINRDSNYWKLFRDFAEQMKQMQTSFRYDSRKFRL